FDVEDAVPGEPEPAEATDAGKLVEALLDRGAIDTRAAEIRLRSLVLLRDPGIGALLRLEVPERIGDPVTVNRLHLRAGEGGREQRDGDRQSQLLHRLLLGLAAPRAGASTSRSEERRVGKECSSRWPA